MYVILRFTMVKTKLAGEINGCQKVYMQLKGLSQRYIAMRLKRTQYEPKHSACTIYGKTFEERSRGFLHKLAIY